MCWEKRQVVQYISKMKVHLLLEKGGTKGKIPFNKQKKTRRKNTTTKRKDINEAIFTLSGLYFNSWALPLPVEDWKETMRGTVGGYY